MDNPYSATAVDLSESNDVHETYYPQIFAVNGRIGRVRYLAYSYGAIFLTILVLGVLYAILAEFSGMKNTAVLASLLIYIPILAIAFIMAIRRLNDLDQSGWQSLLLLVPVVNAGLGLYLMFAPGTKGSNRYGPQPVKNSKTLVVGGLLLVSIAAIGIVAAIAIPAYQQYTVRVKAAQAKAIVQPAEQQIKESE